jgi:nicotinamidase-related amidase
MALTQLDTIAALIVIDLQKGIVAFPTAHPSCEIIKRSAQLAQAFRDRSLPVVLVNVSGRAPGRTQPRFTRYELPPDWTDLVPQLGPEPCDHLVTRQRIGAFIGTSLDDFLRKRDVTQIFLAGIATSIGIESTGRCGHDYGYNVVYVVDAMTDINPEAHRYSTENVFPKLGETDVTENVLRALGQPRVM